MAHTCFVIQMWERNVFPLIKLVCLSGAWFQQSQVQNKVYAIIVDTREGLFKENKCHEKYLSNFEETNDQNRM